jgi:hypothetical protein
LNYSAVVLLKRWLKRRSRLTVSIEDASLSGRYGQSVTQGTRPVKIPSGFINSAVAPRIAHGIQHLINCEIMLKTVIQGQ